MPPNKVLQIVSEIRKADFFNLEDSYYEPSLDRPTYTLTVRMAGMGKTITTYGTRPKALEVLMNKIDELAGAEKWISGAQG